MKVTLENYKSVAEQRSLKEVNDAIEQSRNTERIILTLSETFFALAAMELPDMPAYLDDYDARYGFTVKVTNQELWGKIREVTGTLICSGKDAIGDGRTKKVLVTMTPERADLRYRVKFTFEKKLDKDDKCKVVTRKVKETSVVCNV